MSRKKKFSFTGSPVRLMAVIRTRGDYLSLLLTQIIIESVGMWSALSFLKVKWGKKANTSSRREGQNLMIRPGYLGS